MYTPQPLTGLLAVTGGDWSQRGCYTKNTAVMLWSLTDCRGCSSFDWKTPTCLQTLANQPKSADETEKCNRVQRKSKGTTFALKVNFAHF